MPVTIRHIQGAELPPNLRKEFKVEPHQLLKITIEVEEDTEEFDTENVGDDIIEGMKQVVEARKHGKQLTNAREFLKSL